VSAGRGRHHVTEALRKPPSRKAMLRIPADDLDRARHQAARKGFGCQTYIKILLREGLDRQGPQRREEPKQAFCSGVSCTTSTQNGYRLHPQKGPCWPSLITIA